jgi:hypothetical protein
LDKLQTTKTRAESVTNKQLANGFYYPLDIIEEKEGAKVGASDEKVQAAKLAAAKYVSKCQAMGGRWVRVNPMTERTEFLYVRDGFSDEHAVKNELKQQESEEAPRSQSCC